MEVTTDNKFKPFLDWSDLSKKEQAEFDYKSEEDQECSGYIRYYGCVYSLDSFMSIDEHAPFGGSWSGYCSETFFSGVLIEVSNDGEEYKVGRYMS